MVCLPRRHEGDRFAVGRPARDVIAAGMPGEALRLSSGGADDVDVRVVLEASFEGDPRTIGREAR